LRLPGFTTANAVAFCSYFATFAIFFLTALYLDEVAGYSGYQIAQAFLPMTVLMILASVLAGQWTSTAGLRSSIVSGCLIFGAGLLLTNAALSPRPHYLPLAALALTGIGIGTTVVPITSSILTTVPPGHSGMAASATQAAKSAR
jgi:MFS family permease